MIRRLLFLFSSILLLTLVIFLTLYSARALILGRLLSSKMGTKVELESLALSPPMVDIEALQIANPPGYKRPHALEVRSISIDAPYSTYFKRLSHFQNVTLDHTTVTLEFAGMSKTSTNWNTIMQHLNKQRRLNPSAAVGRYSIIDLLTINDLKIQVFMKGKLIKEKRIEKLTFKNLSTEKGELSRRLTQIILSQILLNIQSIINFPLESANDSVNGLFKGLFKPSSFESRQNNTSTHHQEGDGILHEAFPSPLHRIQEVESGREKSLPVPK